MRLRKLVSSGSLPALVCAFSLFGAGKPAHACGGFFCSQTPIDQSGEQIVFSIAANHVTAHIQIAYKGQAKDFAWVVPVLSKPTIGLGSQQIFTQLGYRTQPQFQIDWSAMPEQCRYFGRGFEDGLAIPSVKTGAAVDVLQESDVGPYHTVVLEAHNSAELISWLDLNGYRQPDEAQPIIAHYVEVGMLFVALKLKQDAGVGDIQPIVLEMDNPDACVPLILTRIAAVNDMPVLVYILGAHRAFPKNWFHVEINPRKINWLTGGDNYRDVVSRAIDEAAGHGFVTEYAGKSSIMDRALYTDGQWDLTRLEPITDPVEMLSTLLSMGFPRDSIMQALLRKYIPMPQVLIDEGVTERDFYNNLQKYQASLVGFVLDTAGLIADLQERVIDPIKKAQAMFDTQPYLTRLLSTVSPDEMTRDPLFHFNADMPDVSNVHTAKASGMCLMNGQVTMVTLKMEDGSEIFLQGPLYPYGGSGQDWPYAQNETFARRMELIPPAGAPVRYLAGQVVAADQYLDREDPSTVRARTIPDTGETLAAGGCTVGGSREVGRGRDGRALAWVLAMLVGVAVVRRRRGLRQADR